MSDGPFGGPGGFAWSDEDMYLKGKITVVKIFFGSEADGKSYVAGIQACASYIFITFFTATIAVYHTSLKVVLAQSINSSLFIIDSLWTPMGTT